jgi:hypothetical protein
MCSGRLLGHRPRFHADGATLEWSRARGCGAHGGKRYETPEQARRYALVFNREDLGRRPLLSLLPLRFARRKRRVS